MISKMISLCRKIKNIFWVKSEVAGTFMSH